MSGHHDSAIAAPLVIGVTGHRHLRDADIETLRTQVRTFFLDLQTRYPDLPLVVLSPLAEGGDRLVAEVAFDLGLRVIAPLPLPGDQYRDDFDGDDSLAIFEQQLVRAQAVVLPASHAPDREASYQPGPARDRRYAEAGIFVSRHCHLLLALWDGDEAALLGGTGHVVRFHLHGEIPGQPDQRRASLSLLGIDENTLVRHIPTARAGSDGTATGGGWLTAEGDATTRDALPDPFDRMFRCQAAFNVDSRRYAEAIAAAAAVAADTGTDAQPSPPCPIHRLFTAADWLARLYQKRVGRVLRLTYALAAATGFALILYDHVEAQDAMIYLYLLLFAVGVGLALLAGRREWHRKYLDYRALAEGLRVQSWWRRAGVVDLHTPSSAHDNFMQEQDIELGWIRNVMRGASLEGVLVPVPGDPADAVDAVVRDWIGTAQTGGQLRYFADTAARRARLHHRSERLALACLAAGIGISVLLAIFAHVLDDGTKAVLVVAMGLASVAAAVDAAYAHKKADKELVKQYRFMQRIYDGARRRLARTAGLQDRREILRTLGEAALAEHAEWTLMHRERPLEHPRLG